ncbi:HD-GYP domain-containing protein [Mesoaciditoga sp.]
MKVFFDSTDEFLKSILEKNLKSEGVEVTPFDINDIKNMEVAIVDVRKKDDLEKIRMIRERNGRTIIFGLLPYRDEKLKEDIFNAGADEILDFPFDEEELRIIFPALFAAYKLGKPYSSGRISDFLTQFKKMFGSVKKSESLGFTLLKKLQLMASYRDNDTSEHTQRVGKVSEILAEELGLAPEMIIDVRLTAPLHDIGKIGIPDSILLKKGKLDEKEWEIMKTHTQIGAKILESEFDILKCAQKIALYHHEKYDGSGYPTGLKGEEIPIEARIVTVADSFDAIVSERPYKPPRSYLDGLEELKKNSGTQFDPKVVDAFIRVSEKIFTLYKNLK